MPRQAEPPRVIYLRTRPEEGQKRWGFLSERDMQPAPLLPLIVTEKVAAMTSEGWMRLSDLASVLGDGPMTYAVPVGMAAYSGGFARLPWLHCGELRDDETTPRRLRDALGLLAEGGWKAIRVTPAGEAKRIKRRAWSAATDAPAAFIRSDLLRVVTRKRWTPEREPDWVDRFYDAQRRGGEPLLVRAREHARTDGRTGYDALVHRRTLRKKLPRKETEHGREIQAAVRGLRCLENKKPEPQAVRSWLRATNRWAGEDVLRDLRTGQEVTFKAVQTATHREHAFWEGEPFPSVPLQHHPHSTDFLEPE